MSNPNNFRYDITWNKKQVTGFLNAKRMPLRSHEDVLVFYKKLPVYNPQFTEGKEYHVKRKHGSSNYGKQRENETRSSGKRYPVSVLEIPQIRKKGQHPTQKPVALFEYLIKTYTNEGDTVLDNVMGSGTTGVACKNLSRNFIGIELDEEYFKIATERINEAGE